MPNHLSSFEQELRQKISKRDLFGIEKTLGLPRQLFASLLDEPSDWSFVIKLAVILEAAVTQVIASRLDTPELQRHLARLNLNGRTGKLQLAIDLGVIDQIVASKIRAISEIRNTFAHDVTIINKSLIDIIESMSERQRSELAIRLLQMDGVSFESSSELSFSGSQSRFMLWYGGGLALGLLARAFDKNEASKRWIAAQLLVSEAFFAQRDGDRTSYFSKLQEALDTLEQGGLSVV